MYILHYAPDNASLIIRLVLEELGQPYRTALVDRAARAQEGAAYLRLNPQGLIPVLETPQGPLFETGAILLSLSEVHGAMAPAPGDAARGGFLKWLFVVSNSLHTDLRQVFYPEKYAGSDRDGHSALTRARVTRTLGLLDGLAGDGHGWFNAADPTILDYYVATCLRWLALYPKGGARWFDIAATPALQALAQQLEMREAVKHAMTAEGLGATPFSAPSYASPPEGSAT